MLYYHVEKVHDDLKSANTYVCVSHFLWIFHGLCFTMKEKQLFIDYNHSVSMQGNILVYIAL